MASINALSETLLKLFSDGDLEAVQTILKQHAQLLARENEFGAHPLIKLGASLSLILSRHGFVCCQEQLSIDRLNRIHNQTARLILSKSRGHDIR
jgi:hypothetical protein